MNQKMLKFSELFLLNIIVDIGLEPYSRFLNVIQQALNNESDQFAEKIAAYSRENPKFNISSIQDHEMIFEEFLDVKETLPRLFFSNFLTSCYSAIEHNLYALRNILELEITPEVKTAIGRETGIKKEYIILKHALDYVIPPKLWQELKNIQWIRNRIIHHDGRIPFSESRIDKSVLHESPEGESHFLIVDRNRYKYLSDNGLVKFSGVYYLNPTYDYCSELVTFMRRFFDTILHDFMNEELYSSDKE